MNWPSLVTSSFVVQKIYSKIRLISCTNTHPDVIMGLLKIQRLEYLENGT